MKNSKLFFLVGSALMFFWIIGGFSTWISWEQRLFKIVVVGGLVWIAWILKNSKKEKLRKGALVITLMLAAGTVYAEPFASHMIFDHHHHHIFCSK